MILEVQGLRKQFGSLVAVNDVRFSVEQGHVVGLVGPNGAGKTTLLRLLATLLRPTEGSALILGYDLCRDYLEIRKIVGFLPDFFNLYNDLTLRECLQFFAHAYGVPRERIGPRVDEVLQFVELRDKRDDLIRHLSRGMVQRLGLGTLLVRDPMLYLLDEPASGLDPLARIRLRDILRRLSQEGKTVIISSHVLTELADFCSHVAIMDHGRMVLYGAVDQIRQSLDRVGQVTVCVLGDAQPAVEVLRTMPQAQIVEVQDRQIVLEVGAGLEALADLNKALVDRGIRVVGLQRRHSDLEGIFLQVASKDQTSS